MLYVILSADSYETLGPRFRAGEPLEIDLAELQKNRFFIVAVDEPGAWMHQEVSDEEWKQHEPPL